MKRTLKILCSILVWTAIAAYLVFACINAARQRKQVEVKKVLVTIADSSSAGCFVTSDMVKDWIASSGVKYKEQPIDAVNTSEIERTILRHSFIKEAHVYTDLEGTLGVKIHQRRPVARLCSDNGYDFFISEDGYILPVSGTQAVYLPIITGTVQLPFKAGTYGDYQNIIQRHRDEFIVKYTEAKALKDKQSGAASSLKAEKREVLSHRPMLYRLYSKSKKDEFRRQRDKKVHELESKISECEKQIAIMDRKMDEMVEKQKKSEKTYGFLPKLLTFVKTVTEDDFWNAQIVQINLLGSTAGKEPEVELIPRAGNHVIRLGHLENVEAKLDKLLLFYREVLAYEGWNGFRYIDLRFDNQIVCTK